MLRATSTGPLGSSRGAEGGAGGPRRQAGRLLRRQPDQEWGPGRPARHLQEFSSRHHRLGGKNLTRSATSLAEAKMPVDPGGPLSDEPLA